jgi:microcystin-dependent protein
MSQPFVGELRLVGFNFAPVGWATCDGQLMPIDQNQTLFQLIGTTYGGDGQTTFALPDLRGRVPVGIGQGPGLSNYVLGQNGGVESVTLTTNQIPVHSHTLLAHDAAATSPHADGVTLAVAPSNVYHPGAAGAATMNASMCSTVGGSQPHENRQPILVLNWVISLFGIFPSQT